MYFFYRRSSYFSCPRLCLYSSSINIGEWHTAGTYRDWFQATPKAGLQHGVGTGLPPWPKDALCSSRHTFFVSSIDLHIFLNSREVYHHHHHHCHLERKVLCLYGSALPLEGVICSLSFSLSLILSFNSFFFLSAGAFSSFLVHVKQSFLSFPHGWLEAWFAA